MARILVVNGARTIIIVAHEHVHDVYPGLYTGVSKTKTEDLRPYKMSKTQTLVGIKRIPRMYKTQALRYYLNNIWK